MTPTLVYLHGFLSSPQSEKATQTAAYLRQQHPHIPLIMPQLPADLKTTLALITDIIQQQGACRFIGTSLGGFLSSWAVEQFGGRAVLINPAVHPLQAMTSFLGWQENIYTGERIFITEEAVTQLQSIEPKQITPDRYWVCLQEADEILDYRIAKRRYQQCKLLIEPGGNHAFMNYDRWLPNIIQFLYDATL
jgi:predicted esterase YcpF (UPF0227 family)